MSKDDKRSIRFNVRLGLEDRKKLEYIQKYTGQSFSAIVRNGIRCLYNLERAKHN